MAVGDNLQTVGVIHRVIGDEKSFRCDEDKERSETQGNPEKGFESGTSGTGCGQGGRCHYSPRGWVDATRETAVISFGKRWISGRTSEDLKIDFHFILHLDDSATDTDGRDSKIGLFENGVSRVELAGLFHGQA